MERICKSSKYAEKFIITDKASCIPTGNSNRTESQTYLNFSIVVRFFILSSVFGTPFSIISQRFFSTRFSKASSSPESDLEMNCTSRP